MKLSSLFLILSFLYLSTGIHAQANLIASWSGNGNTGQTTSIPTSFGWAQTSPALPWTYANGSSGCRYADWKVTGGHSTTAGFYYYYPTSGVDFTERVLWIRWDGIIGTGTYYTLSLGNLTACKSYTFKWKYAWHNNATVPTLTAGICTSRDGITGTVATKNFVTNPTKCLLGMDSIVFTPDVSGSYFLSVTANTAAMVGIAGLSLTENNSPEIISSASALTFNEVSTAVKFRISGNLLTTPVTLTAPQGITLSTNEVSVADAQCGLEVTASYDMSRIISNDKIVMTSGNLTKNIPVSAFASGAYLTYTTQAFSEQEVKRTIREMLALHLPYGESQYKTAGYFGNGQSVEHGARTNADYALIYAFIYKKAQDQALPIGISFATVRQHALDAIRYSYNTHQTGTQNCTDSKKWGLVWESSMWATSTAYAAWLMWDELTETDKAKVKALVIAEADFKLSTPIPVAVNSDTKAEENGWDTNILAMAVTMFPDEKNADAWDYRCKQYAMNTYSVGSDYYNYNKVDGKYVRDWHIGANLFPDYALENHDFFHTSYLNIPIQEMSESLLAYKAILNQSSPAYPMPEALKHNVSGVWNSMLKEFIMADGILAMPNGNDWSMYIYDELGTYSALAAIYRDPDALMLESIILQYARMRQKTTSDGSFLLNPDVGERRMGVTGRRLVFAHLYHDYFSTNDLVASQWQDFSRRHEKTKFLPFSRIVRSSNDQRYVTFSWFQSNSGSYKSYMGMVSPNSVQNSNIVFPFKAGNTGNFTGYIDVSGQTRNASLVTDRYLLYPKSFTTVGRMAVDNSYLTQYSAFYATPGNAVIYLDEITGATAGTIAKEGGVMLGITTDIISKLKRTLYHEGGSLVSDGTTLSAIPGNWVNVDNVLGMIVDGANSRGIAFGEKEVKTSVGVSKLYGSYSATSRSYTAGQKVASRAAVVYSGINSETTRALASKAQYPEVAAGWKAAAVEDPDGRRYLLMANFTSAASASVSLTYPEGAPVFDRVTTISNSVGTADFNTMSNVATPNELYTFVNAGGATLKAVQGDNPYSLYLYNPASDEVTGTVSIWNNGSYLTAPFAILPESGKFFEVSNGNIVGQVAAFPEGYRNISRGKHVIADNQWPDNFPQAIIDEDDNTSYKSLTNPTNASPQNLTVRLWGLYSCDKLRIKATEQNGPRDIQLQVSNDGNTFSTVATTSLLNTTEWQTVNFPASDARYFRIRINSAHSPENVGVNEIQLFGSPK